MQYRIHSGVETMNPLTQRATAKPNEDFILCIICGTIFAALTLAFII